MCMRHGAKLVACGDPSTQHYVASTSEGVERGSIGQEGRVAQTREWNSRNRGRTLVM